ncbi:hypothetical protein J6590_108544 [Homalodisca vitripennis]|nr:hypothetical protein J6590_108544 [Homalodisca vitripennis]
MTPYKLDEPLQILVVSKLMCQKQDLHSSNENRACNEHFVINYGFSPPTVYLICDIFYKPTLFVNCSSTCRSIMKTTFLLRFLVTSIQVSEKKRIVTAVLRILM